MQECVNEYMSSFQTVKKLHGNSSEIVFEAQKVYNFDKTYIYMYYIEICRL
jgi:hypothetical protein